MEGEARANRRKTISMVIFSVLVTVVTTVLVAGDLEQVKALITRAGWWGAVLSVGVYVLLGVTLVPSEPLTLLIGALFGPPAAMLTAGVGNTLASVVVYYFGRKLGKAANFVARKEKLPLGLGKLPVDSPLFLIGARMIPGYGAKAVSLLGGVYHVPLGRFIWTTALPTFAGASITAFGGFELGKLL